MAAPMEPGGGSGPAPAWEQAPVFVYSEEDLIRAGVRRGGSGSRFDTALLSAWEERLSAGCFRYRLPRRGLPSRVLPGPRGLVVQLNPERARERRPPQEILSLRQPFDPQRFNFTRIPAQEVLFRLRRRGLGEAGDVDEAEAEALLVINVSPLEWGHVLLLPEPSRRLPQLLTRESVLRALELLFLSSDPGFRVGFNSLGAEASVNHLHLHGYYLGQRLELEWAATRPLLESGALASAHFLPVHLLSEHPARGLVLYTDGGDGGLARAAHTLHALTGLLIRRSLAHNLFLTRGCPLGSPAPGQASSVDRDGARIVLWPRRSCFGAKDPTAFTVALCELAGHWPLKTPQEYSSLTEEQALGMVRRYSLPEQEYSQLLSEIIQLLQGDQHEQR
ncbi:GDP-D-glucose phosphorylase 1 [Chiloscyllium plagiosum]|uniref:GDP-D-glucose phosphorylase 1 n=1 Tax=Chiloscyllium plagiosum TaxID=36176 RepID=UPI001CB82A35|nr:GDP-D-glucose phosphorylase 1 [Chiloscyllium plagiosum]